MYIPAINISLGSYGALCMSDLANNFALREQEYIHYVSFHQLNLVDGILGMNNYDFNLKKFYPLKSQSIEDIDENELKLKYFISRAYDSLITLRNGLNLNVNFNAIHINLIFGAFEIEHLDLLKETVLLIDNLRKTGPFKQVRIKCFSILSDENLVSKATQDANIAQTLDALVEIRMNYDVFSHNFILDNKNTQAVALAVNKRYLAFVISEIIVMLIRNEYAILGALSNPIGVFSIGIGMVYFDSHFFTAFFKNKILATKIKIEEIYYNNTDISTSEYRNAVDAYLLPYMGGIIKLDALITGIRSIVTPNDFNSTLRCYEFLLANLLGKHESVLLLHAIEPNELYSVNDMIYWNLIQFVISEDDKANLGLLDLKNYKTRLTHYHAKISDGIKPTDVTMQEEREALEKHENNVQIIIKYYSNRTWRNEIIINPDSMEIDNQLQHEEDNLKVLENNFKAKNCISKFFSRRKSKIEQENSERRIQALRIQLSQGKILNENVIEDLNKLYALKKYLEETLTTLKEGVDQITSLKKNYQEETEHITYLDYEFLHNVISRVKLEAYEKKHRTDLQISIKEILKILFSETVTENKRFIDLLDEKIKSQVSSIINFSMLKYLLNEYEDMNLLKPFDFDNDLKRLKQRSYPFFNSVPTYTHRSHYLKYYENGDTRRTEKLKQLLEGNYTASLPSFIHSESQNKFALITIEVIEELTSIVKYNNNLLRNNH